MHTLPLPNCMCMRVSLQLFLQWDGSEAPRLLERAASTSGSPAASGGPIVKKIAKYSWGDETEKVNEQSSSDSL